MIYLTSPDIYPTPELFLEEHEYLDENQFPWKIARVENGFFVRYFGDPYFSPSLFCITPPNKSMVRINNTKCIFFQDASFETFYDLREILTKGFTDDIWDCIKEFLEERFTHDEGMIESEIFKP